MFTSQGVVAKNSLTYRVWLIGISRKQLKRQDLEVDIGSVIEAVEKLGLNLQAISMCTLGIVKIHHGKACVLLSDCQRASEFAKNLKIPEKATKKKQLVVISNLDAMGDVPSQQSCYQSESTILPTTSKAQITLNEVLPASQFTISNYQDFGNEGQLDFDMSLTYSQVFNEIEQQGSQRAIDDVVKSEDFFEDVGGMDHDYADGSIGNDGNNNNDREEIPSTPPKLEEDPIEVVRDAPNTFVDDFQILAPSDIDAEISENGANQTLENENEKIPSMMDLDSLKSYGSSVRSGKRRSNKRKSIYDEEIIIGQFQMRENMNVFSDIVLDGPNIAPPTKKLMKVRKESNWELLMRYCHVDGVRSQKGPPARMINFLSNRAMESMRSRCYRVPAELEDIFDLLEAKKVDDQNIEIDPESVDQKSEIVEKWLETNQNDPPQMVPMEGFDHFQHDNVPIEDFNHQVVEEVPEPPPAPVEVAKKTPPSSASRKRKLKLVDEDSEVPIKRLHSQFLEVLEENNSISLESIIQSIYGDSADRKEASRVFMTLLELKKMGKCDVSQEEANGLILVDFGVEKEN